MIYVCIPCHNEAQTIGVLLWKVRKVFADFSREYQIIVVDDGSTDATVEVLKPYTNVLPLTVIEEQERKGYAAAVERLLREALRRTDRPKRDCAILLQGDFTSDVESIPEIVRCLESGADLVVAETNLGSAPSLTYRWLRRWASGLYRRRLRIPGVRDAASGYLACRLIAIKALLHDTGKRLLTHDGWAANAELQGRLAQVARRVETVDVRERHDLRQRPSRIRPWAVAKNVWHSRHLVLPPAPEPAPRRPRPRRRASARAS